MPASVYTTFRASERASESGGSKRPAHAGGTAYAPGGLTKVGERGPEWMYVPTGSRVWPNGQSPTFPGPQNTGPSTLVIVDADGQLLRAVRGHLGIIGPRRRARNAVTLAAATTSAKTRPTKAKVAAVATAPALAMPTRASTGGAQQAAQAATPPPIR